VKDEVYEVGVQAWCVSRRWQVYQVKGFHSLLYPHTLLLHTFKSFRIFLLVFFSPRSHSLCWHYFCFQSFRSLFPLEIVPLLFVNTYMFEVFFVRVCIYSALSGLILPLNKSEKITLVMIYIQKKIKQYIFFWTGV
jgi:hypothetical protein